MDEQKSCLDTLGTEIVHSQQRDMRTSPDPETEFADAPFSIQKEFDILKEIRDIEEEILMMIHISEEQQDAVAKLRHEYRNHGREPDHDSIGWDRITYTKTTDRRRTPYYEENEFVEDQLVEGSRADESPGPVEQPKLLGSPIPNKQPKSRKSYRKPALGPTPAGLASLVGRLEQRKQKLQKLQDKAVNTERSVRHWRRSRSLLS